METLWKSKLMAFSDLNGIEISMVDGRPVDMYSNCLEVQLVG